MGKQLSEAERRLLATWRSLRQARSLADETDRSTVADSAEKRLVSVWRGWNRHPSTRPLWATVLRDRLADHQPDPPLASPTFSSGVSGPSGVPPGTSGRLLGMLVGVAAGEAVVRGRPAPHDRTAAVLFALEGLIRAHTWLRTGEPAEPVPAALGGLQRWLHAHGVAWRDCVPPGTGASDANGWLIGEQVLRGPSDGDPAMLTALARIASGAAPGSPQFPATRSASASATPLGALAALWTAEPEQAHDLGTSFAALTHGDPDGHLPAGFVAVAVSALLHGQDLPKAIGSATSVSVLGRDTGPLTEALRVSPRPPAGRTDVEGMSPGRTGVDALAVAVRAALSSPDRPHAALRSAADHSGDAVGSAMLCGQLLGTLHGPTAFARGPLDPELTLLLERLGEDAATEFGASPENSAAWFAHYPPSARGPRPDRLPTPSVAARSTATPGSDAPASRSRYVSAVLGAAVGEALGIPVQALSWGEIRAQHGDDGLGDYVPAGHPSGRIGSDTQLLLFTIEGMIRAGISRADGGADDPAHHIQHAYQRWLHTQHLSWPRAAGTFLRDTPEPDGWLVEQRQLFQTRAPGRTMMRTLIDFAKGRQAMGTPGDPVSRSRGSAAVTRAVATALWSTNAADAFRVGAGTAALTHGHPEAYLASGTLALLVTQVVGGRGLAEAADTALSELTRHPGHEEVSRRVTTALRLAEHGPPDPAGIERQLGSGWTAPEALGVGLCAALVAGNDFDTGMRVAINHSGNSTTCAAVCGSLLAPLDGPAERWLVELEMSGIIEQLAQDAVRQFGPHPPQDPGWRHRYPPT